MRNRSIWSNFFAVFLTSVVFISFGFFLNTKHENEVETIKNNSVSKGVLAEAKKELTRTEEVLIDTKEEVTSLKTKINESGINEGIVEDKLVVKVNEFDISYEMRMKNLRANKIANEVAYKKTSFTNGSGALVKDKKLPAVSQRNIVCVYDNFQEKLTPYGTSHGELVVDILHATYDGPIFTFDFEKSPYNATTILALSNCDVVNFSFINTLDNDEETEDFVQLALSYLDYTKTIIVASAGNEPDKNIKSLNLHAKIKEEGYFQHMVLITQGKIKNGKAVITQTPGDMIDYVVLNDDMSYKGKPISGTSFAAPIVTGVVANLLDHGVKKDELNTYLDIDKAFLYKDVSYSPIFISEVYNKIKK